MKRGDWRRAEGRKGEGSCGDGRAEEWHHLYFPVQCFIFTYVGLT